MPRFLKRKTCAMPDCQAPTRSRGLCATHYQWERYHQRRQHGAGYFADYVERLDELAGRGRAVIARAAGRKRAA